MCGYLPVCSGGGVSVGGCGVVGVAGGVESEMKEGEGGSAGYGADTVIGVVKHEVVTSMGSGLACEHTVGGAVVLAFPDGDGGSSADNG